MKKTLLWGALCTLIYTPLHADTAPQANPEQTPATTTTAPATTSTTVQPTTTDTTSTVVPAVGDKTTATINCDYKIPAETKTVEQSLVMVWSENATVQAFEFDPASVDAQMKKLQNCFTDQGWTGFNAALEKSGNVAAIKAQNLTVSSQVDGQVQVTEATENQWKIVLPLQVVYQNDKEKVTQLLNINLTVGRKMSGDLGIMQMIAAPRVAAAVVQPANDSTTTPAANTATETPAATTDTTAPATNTGIVPTTNPGATTPAATTGTSEPVEKVN